MRILVYILAFLLLIVGSCKKKDKDPPKFEVIGDSLVIMSLHSEYIDSGVGVIEENLDFIDTVSTIKADSMGTYNYKYVAVDKEGNIGVFSRIVKVSPTPESMVGDYAVVETISSGPNSQAKPYRYEISIAEGNQNNQILIYYFAGLGNQVYATATVSVDGMITIPEQTVENGVVSGSGTINYDGRTFEVDYEYELGQGTDIANFAATYIYE